MNPKNLFTQIVFLITLTLSTYSYCNAQDSTCCQPPDSLKVVSVATSQFCVSWHIKDSASCDTIVGAMLQYRPVGFKFWGTTNVTYIPGSHTYFICISNALPCTLYEWRVRTRCGDSLHTTYSAFVMGSNFTTLCIDPFSKPANKVPTLMPAHSAIIDQKVPTVKQKRTN